MNRLAPLQFAGIRIDRTSIRESLDDAVNNPDGQPFRVFWVYAHCANVAQIDPEYREALLAAERVYNDGVGLEIAGHAMGRPVVENLKGTDWIPAFLDKIPVGKLFLLGGSEENLTQATAAIHTRWPHLEVVGTHHGFFDDDQPVVEQIQSAKPTVLLSVMGVPRQELFLHRHWDQLIGSGVKVGIAGGAILDFFTNRVKRAPVWVQKCRMEWLYRLVTEPSRLWRRYIIGNVKFLWLVWVEWLRRDTDA